MSDSAKRGLQAIAIVAVLVCVLVVGIVVASATMPSAQGSRAAPSLVETYLRRQANDPSSVQVQSVLYAPPDVQGTGHTVHPFCQDGDTVQMARVQFREKNDRGAMVFRDIIVTIRNGRDVIHGDFERRFAPVAHTLQWSVDPAGPR